MTTTTVFQDALARLRAGADAYPTLPEYPRLSNPGAPTTADLLLLAGYVEAIANLEHGNVHFIIGAMRGASRDMKRLLAARLADEERNLLLLDRLRHEANQEAAHEKLMATDSDYADEFEDDVP